MSIPHSPKCQQCPSLLHPPLCLFRQFPFSAMLLFFTSSPFTALQFTNRLMAMQMQQSCVNLAMERDGCSVTTVKAKRQMSKLKTSVSTADVPPAEPLDLSCVPSARSSNVSLFQISTILRVDQFSY